MSYYQPRGGYSGVQSSFATEQMIKDLIDRVNAVLQLLETKVVPKIDQISEDVADIADDMFGDEDGDPESDVQKDVSKLSVADPNDLSDLVRPR